MLDNKVTKLYVWLLKQQHLEIPEDIQRYIQKHFDYQLEDALRSHIRDHGGTSYLIDFLQDKHQDLIAKELLVWWFQHEYGIEMDKDFIIKQVEDNGFKHIFTEERQNSYYFNFRLFAFDCYYYNWDLWISEFRDLTTEEIDKKIKAVKADCYQRTDSDRKWGWKPDTLEKRKEDIWWDHSIKGIWELMGWPKMTQEKLRYLYKKRCWYPMPTDFDEFERLKQLKRSNRSKK